MKKTLILFFNVLMTLSLAQAGMVSYNDSNAYVGSLNKTESVKIHFAASPVNDRIVPAGEMLVGYNADGLGYIQTPVFCVDATKYITGPAYQVSEMGAYDFAGVKAQKIAWLIKNHYHSDINSIEGSALQVAIWEVLHESSDNGYDANSGDFRISSNSSVLNLANDYLGTLSPINDFSNYNASFLKSDTRQSLVVVPEPASIGLLCLGSAIYLKRRKKKVL